MFVKIETEWLLMRPNSRLKDFTLLRNQIEWFGQSEKEGFIKPTLVVLRHGIVLILPSSLPSVYPEDLIYFPFPGGFMCPSLCFPWRFSWYVDPRVPLGFFLTDCLKLWIVMWLSFTLYLVSIYELVHTMFCRWRLLVHFPAAQTWIITQKLYLLHPCLANSLCIFLANSYILFY